MSHVASVDCFVTDLGVGRVVADRLGFTLKEGQRTYRCYELLYGQMGGVSQSGRDAKTHGHCEHALVLQDAVTEGYNADYEIGLVPRTDGGPGWELLYDPFAHFGERLEAKAGVGLKTLKDELAAEASTRQLQREGYRVTRTVAVDGEIQLLAAR